MADFKAELPDGIIKELRNLENGMQDCVKRMLKAGSGTAYKYIRSNAKKAFNDPDEILSHLKVTKTYNTRSGDNCIKIAFYGYMKRKKDGKSVAVPLVVNQREYGNNRGEEKIPLIRPAFNRKKAIEKAMKTAFDRQMEETLKKG